MFDMVGRGRQQSTSEPEFVSDAAEMSASVAAQEARQREIPLHVSKRNSATASLGGKGAS